LIFEFSRWRINFVVVLSFNRRGILIFGYRWFK
jgi:hypothetical protein